jgi:hypothetical protein
MKPILVFVYNADSGLFNTLSDIGHKIFSPNTYQCRLCEITHSYFHMRSEWQEYVENLGIECEFLHRDEFKNKYVLDDYAFPAIYVKSADGLAFCLGPQDINQCTKIEELRALIRERCLSASCPEYSEG